PPSPTPSPYTTLFRSLEDFDIDARDARNVERALLALYHLKVCLHASTSRVGTVRSHVAHRIAHARAARCGVASRAARLGHRRREDRKSTRLNSSHVAI